MFFLLLCCPECLQANCVRLRVEAWDALVPISRDGPAAAAAGPSRLRCVAWRDATYIRFGIGFRPRFHGATRLAKRDGCKRS